uniref:ARAD1C09350p n=1 Tax=Blastobotrys adeninivorans TaxID=409370 RepID=A0A060T0M1_BLAAD
MAPSPYRMVSNSNSTRIYKTPVTFQGPRLFTTATEWTRKRIFSKGSGSEVATSPGTDPSDPTSPYGSLSPPGGAPTVRSGSSVSPAPPATHNSGPIPPMLFGPRGQVLILYPGSVQMWTFSPSIGGGAYCYAGSTHGVDGEIVAATLIPAPSGEAFSTDLSSECIVLQVVRRRVTYIEVHRLSVSNDTSESLIKELVLPPWMSTSESYHISYPAGSQHICVVANDGSTVLFSSSELQPLPLTEIRVGFGSDGLPLIDVKDRWLVFSPRTPTRSSAQTPLKLPPSGPLYERVVENVSSTAAAGLKSLSDAGLAGLRHYLKLDDANGSTTSMTTGATTNNTNSATTSAGSLSSGREEGGILGLFQDSSQPPNVVQVIDIPSETTIATFVPLYGISKLSLSPYDLTVATVSSKGDHVYTYDLSMLPKEVSVTGRYVRGKLPATVSDIIWDTYGGIGIITTAKGSVHWFDKRRSLDSSNKVWKLSGWGVHRAVFLVAARSHDLNGDVTPEPRIMMLRQGQVLVADVSTGSCSWKYDMPLAPFDSAEDYNGNAANGTSVGTTGDSLSPDNQGDTAPPTPTRTPTRTPTPCDLDLSQMRKQNLTSVDPLSYYEMETCLPYQYIHMDRHIDLSNYEPNSSPATCPVFGLPFERQIIDLGRPNGQAKFSPSGTEAPDQDELRRAMESMVLANDMEL